MRFWQNLPKKKKYLELLELSNFEEEAADLHTGYRRFSNSSRHENFLVIFSYWILFLLMNSELRIDHRIRNGVSSIKMCDHTSSQEAMSECKIECRLLRSLQNCDGLKSADCKVSKF